MLDFKYKLMKKKQFFVVHQRQLPQKTLRVMKLTLILCLVFLIKVNARGFSQDIRVSLDCQNERLGDVFKELEKQTNYFFFFNVKSIDTEKRVSLSFKEEELERALKRIVGDRYQYELSGNLIIVTESKLGTPTTPQAQKRKITGTVKDKKGEPLPGVNVLVKGTSVGVATDINGKFIIESPVVKSPVLVFSFVGMLNKEVTVSSDAPLNVVLEDEEKVLDDVIVTGYRSISKTTFTGSSTKLQQDDIKLKGVMDVSRMLEGAVAGVSIQNVSGTFGAAPKVRVRGATSLSGENKPLWVIDGIVHEDIVSVSNDDLTSGDPTTLLGSAVAGLNANDIESIDILKDAAATALYGARAMNGLRNKAQIHKNFRRW